MTFAIFPYRGKLIQLDNLLQGRIFYRDFYFDLKSKQKIIYPIKNFLETFKKPYNEIESQPRLTHFFYELGFVFLNLDLIKPDEILAIDLIFEKFNTVDLIQNPKAIDLKLISDVNFKDYQKKILKGLNEIKEGNCYQFNLTYDFKYEFSKKLSPADFVNTFFQKKNQIAPYAMFTFIEEINKAFMTNSPECLFEIKKDEIYSRPIKGTRKWDKKKTLNENFNLLTSDKKCESELFMIADLIRNDLNRIFPPNCQVIKKKLPLKVPGLIHQYTLLKKKLDKNTTQIEILSSLFPGGSITGAPKKRVMTILKELENRSRGFYCGSSWLRFNDLSCASINIRSAQIDFKKFELIASAGGGITLRSDPYKEYLEMSYKRDSLISTLTT